MFSSLAFCRLFSSALPRMKCYLSACIPRGGIKDKIQGRFGEPFEERAHQKEKCGFKKGELWGRDAFKACLLDRFHHLASTIFFFCRFCCDDMGIIHRSLSVSLSHTCRYRVPHPFTHPPTYTLRHLIPRTQTNTLSPPAYLSLRSHVGFFWQSEVVREMERKWHRAYFHKSPLLAYSALAQGLSAACLLSLAIRHSQSAKHTGTRLSSDRREDREKCQRRETRRCACFCGGAWERDVEEETEAERVKGNVNREGDAEKERQVKKSETSGAIKTFPIHRKRSAPTLTCCSHPSSPKTEMSNIRPLSLLPLL